MGHLSLDWYQRAYQVASKFFLENAILQELKKLIDLSTGNNNNGHESRNPNSAQLSYREGISSSGNGNPMSTVKDANNSSNNNGDEATSVTLGEKNGIRNRPRSALPRLFKDKNSDRDDPNNASSNNLNDDAESRKNHRPFTGSGSGNGFPQAENFKGVDSPTQDYRPKSAISKLGGGYNNVPSSAPQSPSHREREIQASQPNIMNVNQNHGMPPSSSRPTSSSADLLNYHAIMNPQPSHKQLPPYASGTPFGQVPYYPLPQYTNLPPQQQQQPQGFSANYIPQYPPHVSNHHGYEQQSKNNGGTVYYDRYTNPPSPAPGLMSPYPANNYNDSYNQQQQQQQYNPQGFRGQQSAYQQQQTQPQLQQSLSSPVLVNPSNHSIVLLPSHSLISLDNPRPSTAGKKQKFIEPKKTHASELLAKKRSQEKLSLEHSHSRNSSLTATSNMKKDGQPEMVEGGDGKNILSSNKKSNKTLISKVLNETKKQSASQPNLPVPPTTHQSASNPHHTTGGGGGIAMNQAQNPLLLIDEFGRDKIKKIADMCFPYFKGLRIEAKYQIGRIGDRGRWYPGRIIKADFINGLYDVEFENGDREKNISVENIRIPEYASKLLLLQSTTKTLINTVKSKKNEGNKNDTDREQDIDDSPNNKKDNKEDSSSHSIPSRVLRKQYEDEMHSHALKLLAGINQRAEQRKIERLHLKNLLITKIQSLIRGAMLRIRFPKIRQQIMKEKELRQKEKELNAMEEMMNNNLQKTLQVYKQQQVVHEVQTGDSLIEFTTNIATTTTVGMNTRDEEVNAFMEDPANNAAILFVNNGVPMRTSPTNNNNLNNNNNRSMKKPHPPAIQQPFISRPIPDDVNTNVYYPGGGGVLTNQFNHPDAGNNPLLLSLQNNQHNLTNINSFLESPIETGLLDDDKEISVKYGKFVNEGGSPIDILGDGNMFKGASESDLIILPNPNGILLDEEEGDIDQLMNNPQPNHHHHHQQQQHHHNNNNNNGFLQTKLQEIDKLQQTLQLIQHEQNGLKELDIRRNQEILQQFHSLHELLLLQTEELKQLKKEETKKKVELELYIQSLLSQQQQNLQSFQEQHLHHIEEELESIHHQQEQLAHFHPPAPTNTAEIAAADGKKDPPKHENTATIEEKKSIDEHKDNQAGSNQMLSPVHSQPPVTEPPATMTSPHPSANKIVIPESSITLEVSVENSLLKPDDLHLLEEFGQLGVEDFWNSISTTEFPVALKPSNHNNTNNPANNAQKEASQSTSSGNQLNSHQQQQQHDGRPPLPTNDDQELDVSLDYSALDDRIFSPPTKLPEIRETPAQEEK